MWIRCLFLVVCWVATRTSARVRLVAVLAIMLGAPAIAMLVVRVVVTLTRPNFVLKPVSNW